MPRPRYRRTCVDVSKLNPFDANDMVVIAREWERMQARKARRSRRRQWVRVMLVGLTYLISGAVITALVYLVVAILRSL